MGLTAALMLSSTGCGDDEGTETPNSSNGRASSAFIPPELPVLRPSGEGIDAIKQAWPPDGWWRESHAVTLMLAGGQRGKLKPCGCSTPQLGGVKRMATLVERMRQRASSGGAALTGLALGSTLHSNSEPQQQTKAEYFRAVYSLLGFSGLLLGDADVTVPAMTQAYDSEGELGQPRPPINVHLQPANFAAGRSPYLDLRVGPLALRALHVLEPADAESLQRSGVAMGQVSVTMAFQHSQPTPETVWVVAFDRTYDGTLSELQTAVKRVGPAIIVDLSGGAGEAVAKDKVLGLGEDPLVLSVDELGKTLGVLDLDKNKEGRWVANYRRIPLPPDIDKWKSALGNEVESLLNLYIQDVAERDYLGSFPTAPDEKATYVGSARCASCHQAIYVDWTKSKHAHALDTLSAIQYDQDPECIRCHVVGWERADLGGWTRRASGFESPERSQFLGGVGCENCHGPGSAHVADPWNPAHFADHGPGHAVPTKIQCMKCHDIENSHGFADGFDLFRAHIDHRVVDPATKTLVPAKVESDLKAKGLGRGSYSKGK